MKNGYRIEGSSVFIKLNRGLETVIDLADLDKANMFPNTWTASYNTKTKSYYVTGNTKRNGVRKSHRLHRYIMGALDGEIVDHKNHDTLDNRRSSNLRMVTNAENMQNPKGARSDNKVGARNVCHHKGRKKPYEVRLRLNGKITSFGYYETLEEASEVAKQARKSHLPYSSN